jgi:hypothetical protein
VGGSERHPRLWRRSEKVHVVEFGANLRNLPSRDEVADFVEQRLSAGEYRFLFLGADWTRKRETTRSRQ